MPVDICELFERRELVKVCAPMVRYSKLAFRTLVRLYNCDVCFTPMILADSFIKSEEARNSEFTTFTGDQPLIVQFAANNTYDFATAAEMVARYSNGVDLNCGCPQRWAISECVGAYLLDKPQLVKDMVLQVRNRIPHPYSVSAKIRIKHDIRLTVELCRTLEAAGLSFITVHARTVEQRNQPINQESLKLISHSIRIPVVANGDVRTLADAEELRETTRCKGVMSARGILTNPAMFAGYHQTPVECVQEWITLAKAMKVPFKCFHHHLVFMLEKVLAKQDRLIFNCLKDEESVLKYLKDYFDIFPKEKSQNFDPANFTVCDYSCVLDRSLSETKSTLSEDTSSEAILEHCCIFNV
ncbi:tRNA-dihydrouridine(20a/20b) synthase [NAD(P)+]-like [Schistocerca americana]|uniref:tRNA-dihydrouridine(20a/20b) synthase [NAD(P)+]-like n=1 Tax=Schistocerca americana TaxID=7009 RepID=UPI001F50214E|nr:tRNA-dihydrouridine(20a/20b) synthase [NAD(P)+]-like [Schistocerca americana]